MESWEVGIAGERTAQKEGVKLTFDAQGDAAKPADLPEKTLHYLDGEFVASIAGDEFDVLDPVTTQNYIKAASGKPADIDKGALPKTGGEGVGLWVLVGAVLDDDPQDS